MEKYDIFFNEEKHEYYVLGVRVPSVSEILEFAGYQNNKFIDPIFATRGSFVHLVSEIIDKEGTIDYSIIPPEWIPFVTAYEWFKADTDYEIVKSEYKMFNQEHLYCGTSDREYAGKIQGDIKTGYYQAWHEIQLAAYMEVSNCETGVDIYLTKEGNYKVRKAKNLEFARKRFLSAVDGYWYHRKRDYNRLRKLMKEYENSIPSNPIVEKIDVKPEIETAITDPEVIELNFEPVIPDTGTPKPGNPGIVIL